MATRTTTPVPTRPSPSRGRHRPSRREIIDKTLALLPNKEGRPLRLGELCTVVGVSERALRTAFTECFGMSPGRYLRLRRLHLLRAALAIADARHETVAGVAARFGYSDLGRMASAYRTLFGEYPSATLLRGLTH